MLDFIDFVDIESNYDTIISLSLQIPYLHYLIITLKEVNPLHY